MCPGSALARMELHLVLEQILEQCPGVQLAGDVRPETRFVGANAVAIPSMPVTFP